MTFQWRMKTKSLRLKHEAWVSDTCWPASPSHCPALIHMDLADTEPDWLLHLTLQPWCLVLYTPVSLFLESHHRSIWKFSPPFHIQIFIYTLWLPRLISILWSFIFLLIFSQKKTLCALNFDRRVIISKILYMSMFFIHHQTVSAQRHIIMLYLLTILPYQIGKVTE